MKQLIESLKATTKKKEKFDILSKHVDNPTAKQFFNLALNPHIKFYQKKPFQSYDGAGSISLDQGMIDLCDIIASRKITGNAAIEYIDSMLRNMTRDDGDLIRAILKKKPDCGVDSTANDVWPGLIPSIPVMLAKNWSDKLSAKLDWKSGVCVQLKSDGLRAQFRIDAEGGVIALTRGGNELQLHGQFDHFGLNQDLCGQVIDGELLSIDPDTGEFRDRKTSNGIANKAVKGTISLEEAKTMVLVAWDIIPEDAWVTGYYDVPYITRLNKLNEFDVPRLNIVKNEIVYESSGAITHYEHMLSIGEEGSMVKNKSTTWSDSRSNEILKLKAEKTCDLVVTNWIEGNIGSKYEGMLGAVTATTSDGLLEVNVGSGFSDKLRLLKPEDIIGSIIEVEYNEIIKSKAAGSKYSLFLPRLKCIRTDKKVPNAFTEL